MADLLPGHASKEVSSYNLLRYEAAFASILYDNASIYLHENTDRPARYIRLRNAKETTCRSRGIPNV